MSQKEVTYEEISDEEMSDEELKLVAEGSEDMMKLVQTKMPFGKFTGLALIDLPEPYVVWFYNEGLPKGELGRLMGLLYEIKANGLEYLFDPLKEMPLRH